MRVQLFDAIDRIAPAYLIGRETGDVMNIAVSDIETLEFFFAHTIGPMFTVIQIFGAGERRLTEVSEANDRVKRAALGLTLHRQTIASFLCGDGFPFFDL